MLSYPAFAPRSCRHVLKVSFCQCQTYYTSRMKKNSGMAIDPTYTLTVKTEWVVADQEKYLPRRRASLAHRLRSYHLPHPPTSLLALSSSPWASVGTAKISSACPMMTAILSVLAVPFCKTYTHMWMLMFSSLAGEELMLSLHMQHRMTQGTCLGRVRHWLGPLLPRSRYVGLGRLSLEL